MAGDLLSDLINGGSLQSGFLSAIPGTPSTNSVYAKLNNSYSGCDMRASVTDPRSGTAKIIGNLSTLSYSIHREVYPIRNCGSTMAKGYTRGQRTIAGSLVFSIFDRYALYDVAAVKTKYDRGVGESSFSLLGDQMAPFNINCVFINEMGTMSVLNIYGVQLIDEGQVMSINDIFIESTHSYVATNIDVMYPKALGPLTALPSLINTNTNFNVTENPTTGFQQVSTYNPPVPTANPSQSTPVTSSNLLGQQSNIG